MRATAYEGRRADLSAFLAVDFARIPPESTARCAQLDGKRLYLTGATGFFGKNLLALCAYLFANGARFEVMALSRSVREFLSHNPWFEEQPWLSWREGDVAAPWPDDGQFDLILHAATDTRASAHTDKLAVFDGILAGTRRAAEYAAGHGVARLLLCGSGAQYGAIPQAHAAGIPESSHLACDSTQISSAYGEAKRASELLAAAYAERHGFRVINTRCFAFVGPGLPLDGHFAIGNFLKSALSGQPITLSSLGEALRSYLYAADLAVWLVALLLGGPEEGSVNVGSDRSISVAALAARVRDLVHPGLEIRPGTRSSGDERHYYIPSILRARALGLEAWTTLDESISRTADWQRLRSRSAAAHQE